LAILWERVGKPVRPEEFAVVPQPAAKPEPERPTVEMAVAAFMADGRDRSNSEATMYRVLSAKLRMRGGRCADAC
jgi:hypothetical protein